LIFDLCISANVWLIMPILKTKNSCWYK